MKRLANKINGKTKLRYIYDIVATLTIIGVSLYLGEQTKFTKTLTQFGLQNFNIGWLMIAVAVVSYNLTRMIHRKNNKGNWFSLITNAISDLISISLGDYGRITSTVPNKILTFLCGVSGIKNLQDKTKKLVASLILSGILVSALNLLGYKIFGKEFTLVAIVSTLRVVASYTAYTLQIMRNGMATQITWTIYSFLGVMVNLLLGNIPSVIKSIFYIPTAFLSIWTWKENKKKFVS